MGRTWSKSFEVSHRSTSSTQNVIRHIIHGRCIYDGVSSNGVKVLQVSVPLEHT
jgi:hypothetical protein